MEALIAIGVIAAIGYIGYRAGKREGSRKGFCVGRRRR